MSQESVTKEELDNVNFRAHTIHIDTAVYRKSMAMVHEHIRNGHIKRVKILRHRKVQASVIHPVAADWGELLTQDLSEGDLEEILVALELYLAAGEDFPREPDEPIGLLAIMDHYFEAA